MFVFMCLDIFWPVWTNFIHFGFSKLSYSKHGLDFSATLNRTEAIERLFIFIFQPRKYSFVLNDIYTVCCLLESVTTCSYLETCAW